MKYRDASGHFKFIKDLYINHMELMLSQLKIYARLYEMFCVSFVARNLRYNWGLFLCNNGVFWNNLNQFTWYPYLQVAQEYTVKFSFSGFDFLCTRSLQKQQHVAFFPSFFIITWNALDLIPLLHAFVKSCKMGRN